MTTSEMLLERKLDEMLKEMKAIKELLQTMVKKDGKETPPQTLSQRASENYGQAGIPKMAGLADCLF